MLEPTEDILAELGRRRRPGQVLVGFAADEGAAGLEQARAKRERKRVNLLVFNDVSRSDIGFDVDDERGDADPRGGRANGREAQQGACAAAILDEVAALLEGG